MTLEEEHLRQLQQQASQGDKEAATMLALMADRPEASPDPRIGIQNRANEAYKLPDIDIEQQRANIAADTAKGNAIGLKTYEDEDKWSGGGLGLPIAALMNLTNSQKNKKEDRQSTEVRGLRRAREAKRLAAEKMAGRQGNIAANSSIETVNNREAGQDFTTERYETKRTDAETDRNEERAYKARLLEDSNARADRLKPSGTQIDDYGDDKGALDSISDMANSRSSLSEADRALYGDAMRDIGTNAAPVWAKGVVSEKAYGGSSAVQKLRAQERKAMAEFRRLISGKQVTGPEFLREADWSPTAAGLSLDERERRWDIIEAETLGAVGRYEETFSNFIGTPYKTKPRDSESDRIDKQIEELERQLNE